ncbi:MAG: hypothetical protein V4513_02220 [Pseudomonadota bacterium]
MLMFVTAAALAAAAPAAPAAQPAAPMPMPMGQMDHSKMSMDQMKDGCCTQTADGKMECKMSGMSGSAKPSQGQSGQ